MIAAEHFCKSKKALDTDASEDLKVGSVLPDGAKRKRCTKRPFSPTDFPQPSKKSTTSKANIPKDSGKEESLGSQLLNRSMSTVNSFSGSNSDDDLDWEGYQARIRQIDAMSAAYSSKLDNSNVHQPPHIDGSPQNESLAGKPKNAYLNIKHVISLI